MKPILDKTIYDHIYGFKTRMNNHIMESRSGLSTCKFPIRGFNCSNRNKKQLEKPFLTNTWFSNLNFYIDR